jgi:hypothetical protein
LKTNVLCLSARNRKRPIWKRLGCAAKTLCSLGASDSVRWCTGQCPVRQAGSGELTALGLRRRRTAINHWTVRWCTGLSGEPTVGRVIRARRVVEPTVRRGHRTVSGAPTALNLQRSASPKKERNPHRTVSGGAPDCPVRQATEGKNCLPGMLSTTPSCLGAIKGTPRLMEEYTKHSLSIPKHQDSNSAHLILCDSN